MASCSTASYAAGLRWSRWGALLAASWLPAWFVPPAPQAWGCPFCSAVSQTLSEEIASMDVAVIAELSVLPGAEVRASLESVETLSNEIPQSNEIPKATFAVREFLKGAAEMPAPGAVQTLYFGDARRGDLFLILGTDPPRTAWSTPLKLTPQAAGYLRRLRSAPREGTERLAFFLEFLENRDPLVAGDAYDEFARAPYSAVRQLKPQLNREQVLAWVEDLEIPASRRRLYLVLLSVCGTADELPRLERMLRSDNRDVKAGLDALVACYLTLAGPQGMPLVEELFLKAADADYADTYAAIMALRFHGTESDVLPRERILGGLRHVLDRPQLADLVIPDLARWEDWSQVERLASLFREADAKTSWVRVPIINYLRACPLPEAKQRIEELERIDPEAVKRANAFFPFSSGSPLPGDDATSPQDKGAEAGTRVQALMTSTTTATTSATTSANVPLDADASTASSQRFRVMAGPQVDARLPSGANPLLHLFVTLVTGVLVMFAQWRILSGAGRH